MDRTEAVQYLLTLGVPLAEANRILDRVWQERASRDAKVITIEAAATEFFRARGNPVASDYDPAGFNNAINAAVDRAQATSNAQASTKRQESLTTTFGQPRTDVSAAGVGAGTGAGGGGGFGGSAAAPSTFAPSPSLPRSDDDIKAEYPEFAAFLDNPEVGPLMRQSIEEGWPEEKLAVKIRATNWWRETPARARQFIALEAQDPAEARRVIAAQRADVVKAAQAFVVPIDIDLYARQLAKGELSSEEFRQDLINIAKSTFSGNAELWSALDRGQTVAQFASSYVQLAAKELEIAPDAIDLSDPKWQRPLSYTNAQGQRAAMSLYDWQKEIRTNEVYGFDGTRTALTEAAQFRSKMESAFGVSAGVV